MALTVAAARDVSSVAVTSADADADAGVVDFDVGGNRSPANVWVCTAGL
jgi:hypothetical protein